VSVCVLFVCICVLYYCHRVANQLQSNISYQFFLEWEKFQTNSEEKIKTHILCPIIIFLNRAVFEIMWKNSVQPDRPQTTIWRMHIACWIPEATNTHSEHVTHCFCTTTITVRKRLKVMLYVHCLSYEF